MAPRLMPSFSPATAWVYPNCLRHFLKPHKSMPLLWVSSEAIYPIKAPCVDGLGVWTALRTEDITHDDLHQPSIVMWLPTMSSKGIVWQLQVHADLKSANVPFCPPQSRGPIAAPPQVQT